MTATKQTKADAIAACATLIADHLKTNPAKIFTDVQSKEAPGRKARFMLIYHLHRCGMSFDRIGKLVRRSPDYCQKSRGDTLMRLTTRDREILAKLPQIPTTLEIAHAELSSNKSSIV